MKDICIMNPTIERLNRKLSLIKILSQNPGMVISDLLQYTEHKSLEKLKKDLGELFMVGAYPYTPADYIEIDFDGDRVAIHLPVHLDRATNLSVAEWLAIYKIICHAAITDRKDSLQQIKQKIETILPHSDFRENEKVWQVLQRAIRQKNKVQFSYRNKQRSNSESRTVDPYFVFQVENQYLAAYCNLRQGIRNFRLDSIQDIEILDSTFHPEKEKKDLPKYIQEFESFIEQANQNSLEAELLFLPSAWYHLSRKLQLQVLQKKEVYQGETYIRAKAAIPEENWFLQLVKSYGSAVVLLQPEHLRKQLLADSKEVDFF
ncbi:MAG: WYL domain-containing protein [Spirochaetota bacterium]